MPPTTSVIDSPPAAPAAAPPDPAEPPLHAPPEPPRRLRLPDDGPLRELLDRITRQPDLPSLARSLRGVRRIACDERSRVQRLAEAITQDVGAGGRVLRLVNTAYYRSAGAGQITSIDRAIQVLGYESVVEMAGGQRLVEDLERTHARQLRGELLRAMVAGSLARELQPQPRLAPEAYLAGQFQSLGVLLLSVHQPETAAQLRAVADELAMDPERVLDMPPAVEQAAAAVLGQGLDTLGSLVARQWGWAPPLRHAMRWLPPLPVSAGHPPVEPIFEPVEQLRLVASLGLEMAPVLLNLPPSSWPAVCTRLAAARAAQLHCSADELLGALRQVSLLLPELLQRLGLDVADTPSPSAGAAMSRPAMPATPAPVSEAAPAPAACPAECPAEAGVSEPAAAAPSAPAADPATDPATDPVTQSAQSARGEPVASVPLEVSADVVTRLAAELERATRLLIDRLPAAQQLPQLLAGLRSGLAARHAVLCLREPALPWLCPSHVVGPVDGAALACFRIELRDGADDLFNLAARRDSELRLDDVAAANDLRPPWHRHWLPQGCCLLLPLRQAGRTLGLLYLDHAEPGALRAAPGHAVLLRHQLQALAQLLLLALVAPPSGPVGPGPVESAGPRLLLPP